MRYSKKILRILSCILILQGSLSVTLIAANILKPSCTLNKRSVKQEARLCYGDPGWVRKMNQRKLQKLKTALSQEIKLIFTNQDDFYLPVLLGNFKDVPGSYSSKQFQNILFEMDSKNTVAGYLKEISYRQFELSGDVFGWFEVDNRNKYYPSSGQDINVILEKITELVVDVVTVADKSVDFRKYDNDGTDGVPSSRDDDGYVDAVLIFIPGMKETFNIPALQGSLRDHEYSTNDLSVNGSPLKIKTYILADESWQYSDSIGINKISIICHEFLHVLGLPDLYDYSGHSMGLGNWCLMAEGANIDGLKPPHISSWCKIQLGWVVPSIILNNQTISIKPLENGPEAYLIWEDGYQFSRYFLLENRQKTSSDENLPGSGLLIYHVDENQRFGKVLFGRGDVNNNLHHKLVDIEEADGRDDLDHNRNAGDAGDPFPGSTANILFNNNSYPNSKGYDGNSTGIEINNIRYSEGTNIGADVVVRQPIGYVVSYDPNGLTGFGWSSETPNDTAWGGVLFKTSAAGLLTAVDLGLMYDVTDFQIKIYSHVTDSIPGTLIYSIPGGPTPAGWHTIELNNSNLWFPVNQEFFIAYKTNSWITVDNYSDYTGRSYYSDDGKAFIQLPSQEYGNFNLRARIRTENRVPCDFNADGDINISDVIALLKFIRVNPGNLSADFDQNGKVNLFDVLTMLTHLKSGNCSDSK